MGNGDMLFFPGRRQYAVRVQGCYLDEEETQNIVEFLSDQGVVNYDESIVRGEYAGDGQRGRLCRRGAGRNAEKCHPSVYEYDMMSTSMLQKAQTGLPEAARIMDQLEDMGVVGAQEGSKGRPVILTREQFDEIMGKE